MRRLYSRREGTLLRTRGNHPLDESEQLLSYFVDYANRSLSTIVIEVCRPLLSKGYISCLESSLFRFAYLKATFPKNHTLNGLDIVFWNFCLSLFSSKYFLSYLAGNLFWLRTCRVAIKVCEKSLFLVFLPLFASKSILSMYALLRFCEKV